MLMNRRSDNLSSINTVCTVAEQQHSNTNCDSSHSVIQQQTD